MKFLSATLLAAPLLASAASVPKLLDPWQIPLQTETESKVQVPGENPLVYCGAPDTYTLKIDSVTLSPNPPQGKLTITANGTVGEDIVKGAYVNLVVKYGLITLISQTADLCDQLGNVDLQCPLKKGNMVLTKEVTLPSQIPPGKYSVMADVYNNDAKQVTCLEADNISFNLPL
ncbi:MD-2-related lipid-recognition [Penicillium longicatenatum]|uniref:MD-2-related lipid-recognition n=1 Tax=Penicillium longicatenatum TaxID=1561947 RepID=UPI002546BC98|nr:MD-2-related lipid-recognition [Penicillium longicatenatum]KAJ5651236.1 MD-2-related lipid-recognition [Penicillium longicatenatum]